MNTQKKQKRGRRADRSEILLQRLTGDLQNGILCGRLPGVTLLARQYGVCPATVQSTLRQLAAAGLVEIRPRSGTYAKQKRDVHFVVFSEDFGHVVSSTPPGNFIAEYGALYNGIYETLCEAGATLHFHMTNEARPSFGEEKPRIITLFSTAMQAHAYKNLPAGCWIKVMGVQDYNCPGGHVTYDNYEIGRIAAEYLRNEGCRKFAYLGSLRSLLFRQRFDSFLETLSSFGLEVEQVEVNAGEMSLAEISHRLRKFILANHTPLETGVLGIFCGADHFMVPLRQELAAAGLSSTQVKHLSCDNNPYYLKGIYPRPAEIDIGMYEIGKGAARMALDDTGHYHTKCAIHPRLLPPEELT